MFKVILSLIMMSTAVFAESFNDEWPIYVYGDASYYKLIFDGIAMIVQDTAYMDSIFKMIFMASTLFVAKGFSQHDTKGVLWNVTAGLGMTSMLLYPSSTVHILDVRTLHGVVNPDMNATQQAASGYSGYYKTDHIPFYLAVSASLASALKYHIIDIATDALTPISGTSFRDSGFATPMSIAENMISSSSFTISKDSNYTLPKYKQNLSYYIEKCIIENVFYIDQTLVHGVLDPKINSLDALAPSNYPDLNGVTIRNLSGGGEVTCESFWNTEIAGKKAAAVNEMTENLAAKTPNINMTVIAEGVKTVAGLEADAAVGMASLQNAMLNIAVTSTVMNAFQKAGTGLSGIELSNELTAQRSLMMNMTDSTGQFKWMIRVVPVLEFLIFGILIFLGIPMALIAGISGSEKGGQMIMNPTTHHPTATYRCRIFGVCRGYGV